MKHSHLTLYFTSQCSFLIPLKRSETQRDQKGTLGSKGLTSKKWIFLVLVFWCCRTKKHCSKQWKEWKKVLFGREKLTQTDSKLTVVQTNFSCPTYERLKKPEEKRLSETARDLFHFTIKDGKFHNFKNPVKLYLLKDPIQNTESDFCGVFQLHFYKNLFILAKNIKIINHNRLTKTTVQKLLYEP